MCQCMQKLAAARIPNSCRVVLRGRGHEETVRAEMCVADRILMRETLCERYAIFCVPNSDVIGGRRQYPRAVWTEPGLENVAVMLERGCDRFCRCNIPDPRGFVRGSGYEPPPVGTERCGPQARGMNKWAFDSSSGA